MYIVEIVEVTEIVDISEHRVKEAIRNRILSRYCSRYIVGIPYGTFHAPLWTISIQKGLYSIVWKYSRIILSLSNLSDYSTYCSYFIYMMT